MNIHMKNIGKYKIALPLYIAFK